MVRTASTLLIVGALSLIGVAGPFQQKQARSTSKKFVPVIPKTWDDEAVTSLELPLVEPAFSPSHVPAAFYYQMPVRPIYKSYPIYAPGKEPSGYFERLKQLEPQLIFDPAKLKTEEDWVRAGEIVFDAPIAYDPDPSTILRVSDVREQTWYEKVGVLLAKDGTLPFARYVIRKKGVVEVGSLSCAMCHTRVMPDGTVIKGAQGNFPFDPTIGYSTRALAVALRDPEASTQQERQITRMLFSAPWMHPDPAASLAAMSYEQILSLNEAIPPGVLARHGTSLSCPAQVPDLIGVKDRKYLDHTGLVRHRGLGDLMRYAALNQDGDMLSRYGDFRPIEVFTGELPPPGEFVRYSDEQLYALGRYIYSLKPPPNPNKFGAVAAKGKRIFQREGCPACHTPPLYTNNQLTPADGFTVPQKHYGKYDVLPVRVGTDPQLALGTRRGTGYYKVPSLKGLWYRGPLEHNGSVATLEDWFDPRRLRKEYVPTGFRRPSATGGAVKGHPFGLGLSSEERKALIAFLKTL